MFVARVVDRRRERNRQSLMSRVVSRTNIMLYTCYAIALINLSNLLNLVGTIALL